MTWINKLDNPQDFIIIVKEITIFGNQLHGSGQHDLIFVVTTNFCYHRIDIKYNISLSWLHANFWELQLLPRFGVCMSHDL